MRPPTSLAGAAQGKEGAKKGRARRGARCALDAGDSEPGAIGRERGYSFIPAFDAAACHLSGVAGTRLCGLFARELRGAPFETLWQAGDRAAIRDLVTAVADE